MAHQHGRIAGPPAALAAMIALALLVSSVTGRAGVQVVDSALAMRLFPLHLHGVPGEEAHVALFRGPAPFVHPHCHDAPRQPAPPGPAEVQAAVSLAGAVACTAMASTPLPPPAWRGHAGAEHQAPDSHAISPPLQPPRTLPPPAAV